MSRMPDCVFNALASEVHAFIKANPAGVSPFALAKLPDLAAQPFRRSVQRRILRQLLEDGLISQIGTRRSTIYMTATPDPEDYDHGDHPLRQEYGENGHPTAL